MKLDGIGRFAPENDRDKAVWAQFSALLDTHGLHAFSRDASIGGHITGSAFVLSPDRQAVLLTHHAKLNIWVQLGGHCDGIADARFTALKEAYEESGLARISLVSDDVFDIDIHQIPARKGEPAHLHYDVRFLCQAEAGTPKPTHESNDLAWVPLTELERYTQETSVLRMCARLPDILAQSAFDET